MKAIIWTKYGPPEGLKLREVEMPAPLANQVLVKVHAASVATPDTEFRRLKLSAFYALAFRLYFGLFKPTRKTILGTEFAGEVVAAGKEVSRFKPGDQVYGYSGLSLGTYAEYLCIQETAKGIAGVMALKPANLSYEQAAVAPFGGMEALHALGRAKIQKGQKVLIIGAGGTIGTYSLQLARHFGAVVTGVDRASKLEMIRSLGADYVIDHLKEDFTKNGEKYDVILDTISKSHFIKTVRSLTDSGIYLNANPGLFGDRRIRRAVAGTQKQIFRWSGGYSEANLLALKELLEKGILKPVIDRMYRLEDVVEAHRYVESGEKKGNVALLIH